MKIQSRQNPKLRFAARLRESAAFRKTEGVFGVEGGREIGRALKGGFEAASFFYCETLLSNLGQSVFKRIKSKLPETEIYEISEALFSKIAVRDRVDGAYAVFKRPPLDLNAVFRSIRPRFILIAESIEKPGNLGALMRAADGAGIDGLLLAGKTADPLGPNVIRASLGTVFSFPVAEVANDAALNFCRKQGLRIIVGLPEAEAPFWSADLKAPLALALGSEAVGVSAYWTRHADLKVGIPMLGTADSLNVSVAGAVLLYECARQRQGLRSG